MPRTQALKSHRPHHDVPAEPEQPELPVEPDEGLIPALIPEDPEHDRLVDPAAGGPDSVTAQAKRDIGAGMVDIDMRATSGLEAKLTALRRHRHPERAAGALVS